MDYDQLFAESNVGVAHQACLSAEGKVTTIESAAAAKEVELTSLTAQTAKLTQDLSNLELSCDELSIKFASLESQRDGFVDQVSLLETTCSGLHDQVSGYELFKEQCEAIQGEQVKALSDRVVGLDSELMALALNLDEEFYPHFLTIIAGRRWIIGHGLRLAVMKCHQSPEYGAPFRAVTGLSIDKGIQAGLVAGIDHGKSRRGLADVASYDPSVEASIVDIMSLLHLEGPSAETLEVSRLQPSYEQLLLPVHWKEDNVVTRETSPSDSLDVVHARVQKLKEGALSHHLSISGAIGVLVDPLSSENLIGEASTSGVPVMAVAITALAISVTAANIGSISPISVANYDMHGAGVQDTPPRSPKIMFEKEDLETTPEHSSAS
ncbi:hypothetical protein Tco_1359089 [Tanacetum coccineum]